jgi:hypothetical protein
VRAEERYRVLADAGVVAAPGATDATASGATLATVQAALAGGDIAALQRVAARRWPSSGPCCGPSLLIISAPTACAPAASCSRHKP